eukprot:TRINITY_DN12495_c0_g1_i1.p1 TRINITY_DN12495_c0_g1~~TRINITY_DN12495_c0_g1_i1.p1  ORF type:complete len:706 (+),score=303.81 TRINITY_DN12495_c0_g1_i1:45-2162(+)
MSGKTKREKRQTPEERCREVLMNEFRELERFASRNEAGIARADLVDQELTRWRVCLRFKPDSLLQKGLNKYAEMLGDEGRNILDLRFFFPSNYPASPPDVMIHEPRLRPLESVNKLVSFNGKVHTLLMGSDWKDEYRVRDIITDLALRLLTAVAEVDVPERLVRPYYGKRETQDNCPLEVSNFATENNFDCQMKVLAASDARAQYGTSCIGDIEHSDRISLPTCMMQTLYGEECKMPIIFELRTQGGQVRHMGISDTLAFVDYLPKDMVIAPDWVVRELHVHPQYPVRLRCVSLPAVRNLLLQPRSSKFYDDMKKCQNTDSNAVGKGTQAILNAALRDSKLTALTVHSGVRIKIPVPGGSVDHMFEVLDVQPAGAVRLIASDSDQWEIEFKLEFAPAPDHEDDEDKEERDAKKAQRLQKKKQAEEKILTELEEQKREQRFNTSLAQRLQFEDETPNVGKQGEVELKLRLPDGSNLDGKFKEGMKISSIAAFVMIRAQWVEDNGVTIDGIQLSTAFPKKTLDHNDAITKKDLHRQRINVSECYADTPDDEADEDEYVAEDTDMGCAMDLPAVPVAPVPAAVPTPALPPTIGGPPVGPPCGIDSPTHLDVNAPLDFPRTSTDVLQQAWLTAASKDAERATIRDEEANMPLDPGAFTDEPPAPTGGGDEERKIANVIEVLGGSDPDTVRQVLTACNWDEESAISILLG